MGKVTVAGKDSQIEIDAKGVYYKQLNETIREHISNGAKTINLTGINGQRYIGGGLKKGVKIIVNGVPGNDLGNFMDGAEVIVNANGQDAISNTMNAGKIVIHGDAGDVLGYGMRGGKLYIRGNVGYRVGIHMKSYKDQIPTIIAGGKGGEFFGEYMAGGILVLLDLDKDGTPCVGNYVGTGMHGGVIYLRGEVAQHQLGNEVAVMPLSDEDHKTLDDLLEEYCADFSLDLKEVKSSPFIKILPVSHRPYAKLYAY